MDFVKKSFGARIKEIRESRKMNQEQLAELVGLESRHLSRIETGKSFTTLENISKIANVLDVELSELFSFEHKKDKEILIEEINRKMQNASEEQIELIYKIVFNVLN
ncbi:MAG: helix-turn-helix transcriptional regulator [Candidatus Gastranaerophilales bacterium]|nr:helix-turn-helix transcriptional regulator [Candidatus Gastranaerophilales bacterium]